MSTRTWSSPFDPSGRIARHDEHELLAARGAHVFDVVARDDDAVETRGLAPRTRATRDSRDPRRDCDDSTVTAMTSGRGDRPLGDGPLGAAQRGAHHRLAAQRVDVEHGGTAAARCSPRRRSTVFGMSWSFASTKTGPCAADAPHRVRAVGPEELEPDLQHAHVRRELGRQRARPRSRSDTSSATIKRVRRAGDHRRVPRAASGVGAPRTRPGPAGGPGRRPASPAPCP